MIAHVRGRLTWAGADQVIVDVGGVGYRALVPASTRMRLPAAGAEVALHTSLQVREDSMTLYGFFEVTELELFETLLQITGIGPRVALAVLSASTPAEFRKAILFEDLAYLTRLPHVGKKTAQRLILELREKWGGKAATSGAAGAPPVAAGPAAGADADPVQAALAEAMEALVHLGYSRLEAGQALETVRAAAPDPPPAAALVRLALRHLGSRL